MRDITRCGCWAHLRRKFADVLPNDKALLPTSCRFLDGMEWRAHEDWDNIDNHPDSPLERNIYLATQMSDMCTCYCIFPSRYLPMFEGDTFANLHGMAEYEALCERVRALVVTKAKDA